MEYRSLGRTGVKVSKLCLGCMMFGRKTDEAESIRMVHRALDAGINFLDTANVYGRGASEEITGKALKDGGRRDRVVLATKVHARMEDEDPNAQGNHRRHIIQQCEASLKRLQTDWIDLYQIHRPDPSVPVDETLRALDDLVRAGKVRYIGTSTFASWQIMEALWVSRELGLNRFVCEQPPYHPLDRRIERELVPMALTYGIGLIPWSPLAGGFFTGKYRRGEPFPEDSRLTGSSRHYGDAAFDVLDVFEELAREKGATPSQVALAWNAAQPGITAPIIGPRTMEQLEDNLGAAELEITDSDRERIDAVAPPGRAIVPFYEAAWGPHTHRW
ncbi:MAG: aldo/keto reductase [Armatimonadota bacterium]